MTDAVVRLAYDEARTALREQDATLANVRNRATALLAATAVGTSFAATVGLLNVDPRRGPVFPAWAGWLLLSCVVVVGAGVMVVLWPTRGWLFGPSARKILDCAGQDCDEVLTAATQAMVAGIASNDRRLRRRMTAYRVTVVVLMTQVALLVLAMVLARG
ncbi:hypothetical protein SAMN05660690_1922 [Geodermatophilus telluris]|uniref:Uncharacterized protein n=1 Tax=Geodermatophilus telluris TaxID=1190417 RepID=A0A1G6MMA8_9ACTN|nr:hypothetical protein [Geodermatophilus telluris]SDC56394.1 hypothetical protein SAMN05660690_1922 [Geodermatophilus telluris]